MGGGITRAAQGEFTFTFTSSTFSDANYAIYGTVQYPALDSPNQDSNLYNGFLAVGRGTSNRTSSACTVTAQYSVDGVNYDPRYLSVVFISS
jgi:hypothetical protein